MQHDTRKSFIIAILIHAVFVGIGLLFLFLENFLKKPEPLVFELVAAAAPAAAQRPAERPSPEPAPVQPLKLPDTQPLKPLPDIPDLPEPEPEPEPPKPEPPKPEVAKPKPEPKPEPPKQISYAEWARSRKLPDKVQKVQQSKPRPAQPVPEIETNVRDRLERQLSPIRLQGADIGQIESNDALQRYLSALRQRIQSAFEPSGNNLQAEVYFTVTASGRIISPRIHQSSGDPAFDRSVLRTLELARTPGPPPGNRDYTFSLVFRSE